MRIIPAYAGQIFKTKDDNPPDQDHPRIRGTNTGIRSIRVIRPGSSPHTRDK